MGIFSWFASNACKSQAAGVVQNLLEEQRQHGFAHNIQGFDPAKIANVFVQKLSDTRADFFNGQYGYRPHKIPFAAAALAAGLKMTSQAQSEPLISLHNPVLMALSTVLTYLQRDGHLYVFTPIDNLLIQYAVDVMNDAAAEIEQSPLAQQLRTTAL